MLKSHTTGKQLIELEKRLADYQGEDRIIPSDEMVKIIQAIPKAQLLKSKISELDNLLNGFEEGELILVTGPTGEGKTTLLMTITKNMVDAKACWFSFEVTPRQFFEKFNFNPPLFYLPAKNVSNTLEWLEERILEAILKHPEIKVIFIDHLHFLFSLNRIRNTSLEIGDMAAKIKEIALLNNLVIFLIAHPQKKSQADKSDPHHDDIRDSSLIAQYADTCMAVWRVPDSYSIGQDSRYKQEITEHDTKAIIRVTKNRRNGKLGRISVYHDKGFFTELKGFNDKPIIENDEEEIKIKDIFA